MATGYLTSLVVLLMISVSEVAFAEDIKLGRKGGWVEMERHGSEEQNLPNWQVNQEGANDVAVQPVLLANGLVKARPDGRVLEGNVWSKNFSDNYAKGFFDSFIFGGGGGSNDQDDP